MYASEDDIFAYPVQVDNDEEDDYGLPSDDDSSKITGTRKEPPSQPRSKTNPFLQENIHVLKGGKEDVHRSVPTSSTHTIQQNATEYALQRLEGRTASTAFYHDQESSKSPMARRSSKVTNREGQQFIPRSTSTSETGSKRHVGTGFARDSLHRSATVSSQARHNLNRKYYTDQSSSSFPVLSPRFQDHLPVPTSPDAVLDKGMSSLTTSLGQMNVSQTSPNYTSSVRVYVQSVQKYVHVGLTPNIVALGLLNQALAHIGLSAADELDQGWAAFDVLPELGLERPIREYERIEDVLSSRGQDPGYFLIKKTPWHSLLRADAIPHFSAVLGGYVNVQDSKKWTKRWLELREHSLFVAKNENVRYVTLNSPVEQTGWAYLQHDRV